MPPSSIRSRASPHLTHASSMLPQSNPGNAEIAESHHVDAAESSSPSPRAVLKLPNGALAITATLQQASRLMRMRESSGPSPLNRVVVPRGATSRSGSSRAKPGTGFLSPASMEPLPKERSDAVPGRSVIAPQRASMEPLPKERSDSDLLSRHDPLCQHTENILQSPRSTPAASHDAPETRTGSNPQPAPGQ